MEGGQAGFVQAVGFNYAEEVLDSVDLVGTEERVPFHVKEEVARGRLRKHQQPLVGDQIALAVPRRWYEFREYGSGLLPFDLDTGLGMDSLQRLPSYAVQTVGQGLGWLCKGYARAHVDFPQGVPLSGGQTRDQGQIVLRPPLGAAFFAPSANTAVLNWLGSRSWRMGGRCLKGCFEFARHHTVVGGVIGDAE